MKYQLVLQWPMPFPVRNLDDVAEIENLLSNGLEHSGDIDGHDVGSGEVNIFIHTDYPDRVFSTLQPFLESRDLLAHTRAAYRAIDGSRYTILWPIGLESFFIE